MLGDYIKKNIPEVDVIYTRHDDTFIELRQRTIIANEKNAARRCWIPQLLPSWWRCLTLQAHQGMIEGSLEEGQQRQWYCSPQPLPCGSCGHSSNIQLRRKQTASFQRFLQEASIYAACCLPKQNPSQMLSLGSLALLSAPLSQEYPMRSHCPPTALLPAEKLRYHAIQGAA